MGGVSDGERREKLKEIFIVFDLDQGSDPNPNPNANPNINPNPALKAGRSAQPS